MVNSPPLSQNLTKLTLGYAIAVSFAFLIFFSTILIAFYICCRLRSSSSLHQTTTPDTNAIIVPRFVFVDDNYEEEESHIVVGLDRSVINSYPKFQFSKFRCRRDADGFNSDSTCAICLSEYREEEMLRMMPDCKHFFHLQCLDAWLNLNGSCPVCRNSPLPTPISTPLAEVVPLAQYSVDRSRSNTSH